MSEQRKLELIDATYEMLKKMPPDQISARKVVAAAGCTSPLIYRNFKDMDELILLAAVRFLERYIVESPQLFDESQDPLVMLDSTWELFAKHGFQNVDVFLFLFFSQHSKEVGDAIEEYYQLLPDGWRQFGGMFTTVLFDGDIYDRNLIVVRRVASSGVFDVDDAQAISDMQCYLFHGMLMKYRDVYRDPAIAAEGLEEFMRLFRSQVEHYRIK
ncbi:MAG: TetR/AcrR family transcriptional regulator [Eggerthellaceae bacterium]|nr:TetR/AcrR family transcriptional regulator [Eggerthellaceae bacterium]